METADPLVAQLRAAGCVYAEDEARLLREAALGEALRALGGFRGRRERARVPSTAGEPSRLAFDAAPLAASAGGRVPPLSGGLRARRREQRAVWPHLGCGHDGPSEHGHDARGSREG